MQCKNHPETTGVGRCAGCAEDYCQACLVQIHGQHYCASCKSMMATGDPTADMPRPKAPQANTALTCSILGAAGLLIPLAGVILASIGLSNAGKAQRAIAMNPRVGGEATVKAARIIGGIFLAISILTWIGNLIMRASRF